MVESRSKSLLALGGNLPFDVESPDRTLIRAVEELSSSHCFVQKISRFFATPCFPAGAGPDYVNAAILLHSDLSPQDLLDHLHAIEHMFGRARAQRWGMRTLDLDVLAIGQTILPDLEIQQQWQNLPPKDQIKSTPDQFILPHPRMQDRAFVLVPLADIAPKWVHPVLNKSVVELCQDLPKSEIDAVRPL